VRDFSDVLAAGPCDRSLAARGGTIAVGGGNPCVCPDTVVKRTTGNGAGGCWLHRCVIRLSLAEAGALKTGIRSCGRPGSILWMSKRWDERQGFNNERYLIGQCGKPG